MKPLWTNTRPSGRIQDPLDENETPKNKFVTHIPSIPKYAQFSPAPVRIGTPEKNLGQGEWDPLHEFQATALPCPASYLTRVHTHSRPATLKPFDLNFLKHFFRQVWQSHEWLNCVQTLKLILLNSSKTIMFSSQISRLKDLNAHIRSLES